MTIPVVSPEIAMRGPSRDPEMTIVRLGAGRGVTDFEGSEKGDQPAPVNAEAVKVYDVPFVKPTIAQEVEGAATRHERSPGDDTTR